MDKKLLVTAVAAMLALSTGIVYAGPSDGVQFDGTISLQNRNDSGEVHETAGNNGSSFIAKFILNANLNLDSHFDIYTRLAAESLSRSDSSGKDFLGSHYDTSKRDYAGIDVFGVKYNNAGFTYKLGRQTGNVGVTGTLYNTESYLGRNIFLDGISVSGRTGVTAVKALIAEDKSNDNSNKLYAVSGSFNPSKNVTLGATLAKYDADNAANRNYWAINAGDNIGKTSLVGEYAKSNADDQNKAYNVTATYAFNDKSSVYVTCHRTETNADINKWTNFDNGEKGLYYGYDYKFDKNATLSFFYKDNKVIDSEEHDRSFRTTVTVNF